MLHQIRLCILCVAGLCFVSGPVVLAKPTCPGHPSCKDDSGDGDPPVESNPAIVYSSIQSRGRVDLILVNADGSAPVPLIQGTKGSGNTAAVKYEHGSWSPNGADIVFHELGNENRLIKRSIDGSSTITVYNGSLDGNNAKPIRQSDWHPLGNWIAFGVTEDRIIDGRNVGDTDVRVVDSNGMEVTNLTSQFDQAPPVNSQSFTAEFEPTWSPGGTRLAFVRWLFDGAGETKQIHVCDFIDGLPPALECETDGDGVPIPWREALEIFSPVWHPSATTPVIAYLESAAYAGGGSTRADLFIESPDDATCIHIKADNSPYPDTRPGCVVHEIGTFRFSVDLGWSCDGEDLIVSGIDPNTNDHGTYLIADVFAASVSPPVGLILPSGGEHHATQAKSRLGCPWESS